MSHVSDTHKYARDVVSGKQVAGKWVVAACLRHLDDLKRSKTDWPYKFDKEKAERICDFIELLPHIKGKWKSAHIVLEPWQKFGLCSVFGWIHKETGLRRFKTVYEEVARKNAKALSLDTLIPTPNGWTTIGEINAGDVVFGDDGQQTTVVETSETFTDHDCYEMQFSNGETVVADAGHLWLTTANVDSPDCGNKARNLTRVKPPRLYITKQGDSQYWVAQLYNKRKHIGSIKKYSRKEAESIFSALADKDLNKRPIGLGGRKRVRTTEEIFNTQKYGKRRDVNHSIDMPQPFVCDEKEFKIHPYVLGAWIGDGHSDSSRITCGENDTEELVGNIRSCGHEVITRKYKDGSNVLSLRSITPTGEIAGISDDDNFGKQLNKLNLLGNKHIPEKYLRASVQQRIALIQGLMDTDGTINKNGRVLSYTTIKKQIAKGVSEVLASLGIKHSISENPMVCSGKPVPGVAYKIQFTAFRDTLPVFKFKRKLNRMRNEFDCKISPRSRTVQIININKVLSTPVKCIVVDSESKMFLFGKSMLPTHNSTIKAGVGLYMLALDGEQGSEVYSAAVSRDQAHIVHDVAWNMANMEPEFRNELGVSLGGSKKNPRNVYATGSASRFEPLSSDAQSLDGLNVHCAIIDELHAHKTRHVFDVLETATGSRTQSVIWIVTTAGSNRAGICYEQRAYVTHLLNTVLERHPEKEYKRGGESVEDDTYFGIIYTIDEDDEWTDPTCWIKANPNLNVSVKIDDIQRLCNKAERLTSAQNNFKTKRLNMWVNADTAWMDMQKWDACEDQTISIEEFAGLPCMKGYDLASKLDIAADMSLFKRTIEGKDHYYAFGRYYLPENRVEDQDNAQYQGWAQDEWLVATPGDVIDFDWIEEDLLEDAKQFDIKEVAFDPMQATQFAMHMLNEGVNMIELPQNVKNLSESMKELEKIVVDGRFHHIGDPVLSWMVSNVVCHTDAKDNIYPRKENEKNKIDGVIALVLALNRWIANPDIVTTSVYENRGVLFV